MSLWQPLQALTSATPGKAARMQQIDSSVRTKWCEVGAEPAAVVDSGEVISVESTSFTEGYTFDTMHTLRELTPDRSRAPLTAPIIVRGARPGHVLRVDVLDLQFTRDFGCMLLAPGKGAFPAVTEQLVARGVRIDDHQVAFSDTVRIPTRKMLGKVSVAPSRERRRPCRASCGSGFSRGRRRRPGGRRSSR